MLRFLIAFENFEEVLRASSPQNKWPIFLLPLLVLLLHFEGVLHRRLYMLVPVQ